MNDRKDDQRRKLFQQLSWVYVYGPPILAVLVGCIGGLIAAILIPIDGTTLFTRWLMAVGVILVLPAVVYYIRSRLLR